jgi:16S rRNA (guanine527-N7)-methyltransferase
MDELLREGASHYGVSLTDRQLEQFDTYASLLSDWSGRMNLVGHAGAEVIRNRHFLESIALGAALRQREMLRPDATILDVGTGAGFPGLVLKIVWPAIHLTLIEATAKKAAFIGAVIADLNLENTVALTGRAETLAHEPALREAFDLVVARAVAPLAALLELTLPFVRVGGRVVSPKGSRAGDEIRAAARALDILGGRLFSFAFDVPGPPQTLIAVAKLRPTPREYPRRAGTPARSPL